MASFSGREQNLESEPLLDEAERFRLLGSLIENDDLKVLTHYPSVAAKLRQERARIFYDELDGLRRAVNDAFRSRLDRIGECGRWTRIFNLIGDAAAAHAALSKLEINGALFRYRIPAVFETAPNMDELFRYFTVETGAAINPA